MQITIKDQSFPVQAIKVSVPGIDHDLTLRARTSDMLIFQQIFVDKEYEFPWTEGFAPELIIDGGAYVGYASAWFSSLYPEAKIIAIEPDEENYQLLLKNVCQYSNVEPAQMAIWPTQCLLEVITMDDKNNLLPHAAIQVKEADSDCTGPIISATSINDLLTQSGCMHIDILKLDVEGSEREIFSSTDMQWLDKTNAIILELHDRYRPGCTEAVLSAISTSEFEHHQKGENHFFIRKNPLV